MLQFVRNLIGSAPSKSCELDPALTFLFEEFLDTLLPFLTRLCNVSLQEGQLTSSQTTAIVTPALKKHGLDPSDMKNYRPISNLSFMSQVVERIVVRQLLQYLDTNGFLPKLQSGLRRHHSTESDLLRVLSDLFSSVGMNGSRYMPSPMSVLHSTRSIMLSHSIDCLFRSGSRHQHSTGCVLSSWVEYKQFTTRTVGPSRSVLLCVPEWLKDRCLDLSSTSSTPPTSRRWSNRSGSVSICTRMIRSSMGPARSQRRLVWLAVPCASSTRSKSGCRQTVFGRMLIGLSSFGWAQVTSSESATCRRSTILSSTDVVNNIGVYLDSELALERQVSKLCQVCYFHLRRLRTVRRSLLKECLRTLVHAFVTSRFDHCNGLLYGSYSYLLD